MAKNTRLFPHQIKIIRMCRTKNFSRNTRSLASLLYVILLLGTGHSYQPDIRNLALNISITDRYQTPIHLESEVQGDFELVIISIFSI